MSDESDVDESDVIETPIALAIDTDHQATLTFGPMSIQDLGSFLEHLGTAQGYVHFRTDLDAAIEQGIADAKAAKAASE